MPRRVETEFRDFVGQRWTSLVRYAYLLTGDAMLAEDLVQGALERCWRRWDRIRTDRPEAYVRTAIARGAISRFRASRVRVRETALDGVAGDAGSSPDGAQRRADADLVWSQLALLPPRMRAVVVLRVYEDLTAAETALLLGCSVGSVKSQLSRAMARLRQCASLRELAGLRSTPPAGPNHDSEVPR